MEAAISFFLVCLIACSIGQKNPASGARIRLTSYNLRNANLDKGNAYHDWLVRRPLMKKQLWQMKPTLIGTQEGIARQLQDIVQMLPCEYQKIGQGRYPSFSNNNRDYADRMNEFTEVFFDSSRLRLVDLGTFELSNQPLNFPSQLPGVPLPRVASWLLAEIAPVNGTMPSSNTIDTNATRIFFMNTHLTYLNGQSSLRAEEFRIMEQFITNEIEWEKTNGHPEPLIFITGDMNEGEGGTLWQEIIDVKNAIDNSDTLIDCVDEWKRMTGRNLPPNFTFHNFQGLNYHDPNGGPIDWVLCTKNTLANIVLENAFIDTTSNGSIYPSDHFPMTLDILVK